MSNIDLETYWPNFIDGEFDHGGAGRSDVFDPSNGMKIAEDALADAKDVDRAVQAAQRVFKEGSIADLAPTERGRLVTSMGKYLNDHIEEIKEDHMRRAGQAALRGRWRSQDGDPPV